MAMLRLVRAPPPGAVPLLPALRVLPPLPQTREPVHIKGPGVG